jgi:hypothetical protein
MNKVPHRQPYGRSKPAVSARSRTYAAHAWGSRASGAGMCKKVERPRGRVGARILLLMGGATAMAGAVALGGLGPVPPADGQSSSPHARSTLPDLTRDAAPAASLPSRPSSAESTSPVPVSLALPHGRTTARGEGDGIEQVGVANKREEVDEPHARREPSKSRRLANTATDRRPSRPDPRSKRGPSGRGVSEKMHQIGPKTPISRERGYTGSWRSSRRVATRAS